ncbi:MAG TPA: DUF222 domain-containing protein [Intrasporangium sp.]|uniref:HNH endonuclease n=1 Tax=Intrasporangium sp. TaxID=1925024 RepID=UPI002D782B2F|nr:DUF222 domain-containing protein [Intrasporangium sp.]HET7399408.1 DUF222 domain-containing protein [Intrasporangium sp.]
MTTAEVAAFLARLPDLDAGVGDAERIEQLSLLEQVKNAAAAAQAKIAVAFDASQREAQAAAGVPASQRGRGVAEQIALARRDSPHRGSRLLGLAKLLVQDLPETLQGMCDGGVSEWRATLVAQAAVVLDRADRKALDAALAGRLPDLSDRQVRAEAGAAAYRADPHAVVGRGRRAVADRRVTVRPAPDVMALVTGYVPAAQGVSVFKALDQAARSARAAGDPRSLDQIKADTFVQRLTGQARAEDVPIEVGLVMTDAALLTGEDSTARLEHYGPLPAAVARGLLTGATALPGHRATGAPLSEPTALPEAEAEAEAGAQARGWLRRLFTDPVDDTIASADTRRRRFDGPLRRLIVYRDQYCRTPWCGAPIRDADHVVPYADGGPTSLANGQGLCQRCNLAKSSSGWQVTPDNTSPHRVVTTTPTGATYASSPPSALGWPPPVDPGHAFLDEAFLDELGIDAETWLEAIDSLRREPAA